MSYNKPSSRYDKSSEENKTYQGISSNGLPAGCCGRGCCAFGRAKLAQINNLF